MNKDRVVALILIFLLGAVLWFFFWETSQSQTIDHTRKSVNQAVRGLMAEEQTAYLADTTLNAILNYAHNETGLMLGDMTDVDTAVVLGVQGQMRYYLNANAIRGKIAGAVRRTETNQGRGDVGMVQVNPDQIGKLGEGVIPNSYAIKANYFLLATAPLGNDTFFVYYIPRPNQLNADTSDITISVEDEPAMIFLSCAMAYARDHQTALANFYLSLYTLHLQSKGIGVSSGAGQQ